MSVRKAKSTLCCPPRCQEPRGMGLPAAAAGCWASLSRVATAWHGRPAATPPTMLLWARGQGKLQARWARCPLSFVGVAQWSRWFRPPGCPRDPPLTFPLSPDPHRDVLRGAYARECSVGPAPVPQRGVDLVMPSNYLILCHPLLLCLQSLKCFPSVTQGAQGLQYVELAQPFSSPQIPHACNLKNQLPHSC